jgi:hypothetical protein
VYFDAQAATLNTIVSAWSRHTPAEITATGRRAIEATGAHFYFTSPAPGGVWCGRAGAAARIQGLGGKDGR